MTVLIIGDEKHSGVFSSCEIKRQGSTAKKYYWPNLSSKLCKADDSKGIVKGTFTSIGINPDTGKPYYDQTTYYQLDDNQPKAKKFVGKSNYASSMQSHKIGATAAFNDLHRLCALPNGGFTYDKYNPSTPSRRAVLENPFCASIQTRTTLLLLSADSKRGELLRAIRPHLAMTMTKKANPTLQII